MQLPQRIIPPGVRIGGIHDNRRFPPEPTLEPAETPRRTPLRRCGPCTHRTSPRCCGSSGRHLLVTTYQAGKLVMVRDEGDHLNTHFRGFQAPMGMALSGDRLAVGTKIQVWEFVDVPAVGRQAGAARPTRRLFPAPLQPRHGQHPDP